MLTYHSLDKGMIGTSMFLLFIVPVSLFLVGSVGMSVAQDVMAGDVSKLRELQDDKAQALKDLSLLRDKEEEHRSARDLLKAQFEEAQADYDSTEENLRNKRREINVLDRKILIEVGGEEIGSIIKKTSTRRQQVARARVLLKETCQSDHLTPQREEEIKGTTFWHAGTQSWVSYKRIFAPYKSERLNEMACHWKGTSLEPYTVPLLAQLLQEGGSLSAETRGDYKHGSPFSFGISQHHICFRKFQGKNFCFWKNGLSPMQQFERDFPQLAFDWESQFFHYSDVLKGYIKEGLNADQMIKRWNSNEVNRRQKINRWERMVELSIN